MEAPARQHTNRLIHETSPYLVQHAHNPVDWYPWGPEALATAKAEGKPILLSIGYAACHWCHVMEHESFEVERIGQLMNEHFVCIKVDREERPDLDQIYQAAVQVLGRQGGWPLTTFLTPDGEPFYGGTYFPPDDRHGIPAFPRVLVAVAEAWRDNQAGIAETVGQLRAALEKLSSFREAGEAPDRALLENAARGLVRHIDPVHGGFAPHPKFPNTMNLAFLLRRYRATKDRSWLSPVTLTLRKMAEGGISDQLGGGFHRYAVDERWLVPHFEKMLYDNALLIPLYVEAYQATKAPLFRRIAEEAVAYVRREMRHPEGGFYSTQDADSEGEEGTCFVWTPAEVRAILGDELAELFCRAYDVTERGNFEHGRSILHVVATPVQIAQRAGRTEAEVLDLLAEARAKLFAARERRVKPFRDEKVLTSWNGLMVSALCQVAMAFGDVAALADARAGLAFIETRLVRGERLLATFKDGQAKGNGFVDDHAFVGQALLDYFTATGEPPALDRALALHATLMEQFWDEVGGGFFFTGRDHEPLITRPRSSFDHSIPAGSSVATLNALRLYHLTGDERCLRTAERVFRLFREQMAKNPFGFGALLCALDFYLDTPREIVIVGRRDSADTEALVRATHDAFVPNKLMLLVAPDAAGTLATLPHVGSLLDGKAQVDGRATAYVCHRFTCSPPITDPTALAQLLEA